MSRSCIYIFCNPFFLVQIWCKTISNSINVSPRSPTKSDSFSHDIQRYLRFQTRSDKTNARAITPSANCCIYLQKLWNRKIPELFLLLFSSSYMDLTGYCIDVSITAKTGHCAAQCPVFCSYFKKKFRIRSISVGGISSTHPAEM